MKRFLIAALIFLGGLGLLLVPTLIALFRSIQGGGASGLGFVAGSLGENVLRVVLLLLLAALAWWISGKLVPA